MRARGQSCARILTLLKIYLYIESISMFENFSILVQSLKGVGEKCNFAPATDYALDSTIASLASDKVLGSTYYLKSSLINCLCLWFFRQVERTLLSIVYLTPTVYVGKMLYLYTIIKKATKKIENLFCSLPDSTMVSLPCCGQVGKNAVRLLFDFKLKQINNVY